MYLSQYKRYAMNVNYTLCQAHIDEKQCIWCSNCSLVVSSITQRECVYLRPQPTRRTSWQLVWSFSAFHLCSKLPTCMSW